MDFFERQDKARKNTKALVLYFFVAVVLIIAAVYLACLLIFAGVSAKAHRQGQGPQIVLWNPEILLWAAGGALTVIICGSVYKLAALSGGGKTVAESLGGRPVQPNTTDLNERKLLNVVEEMALASGVPVPQVYVLDQEQGINAFAAGYTPSDAVIGVTRGAIQTLTRDELQGVIAHEFSHILNGDMRLNIRLIGIIFGILCLAIIGRILIRTRGRKNPLPLLGLALIIIGWVGVFFGRLIQAAVSRQREFLADASAVQFTRNPPGLSGALQKIGGLAFGSKLESEHAEEASHMFFGNGMGKSFFNAMATHPPLKERIQAIDPSWDGKYPRVALAEPERAVEQLLKKPRGWGMPPILPLPGAQAAAAGFAPQTARPQTVRPQTVLPSLGKPTPMHLRYAEELRNSFPESVKLAARDPLSATALTYALVLSDDETLRANQLKELAQKTSPSVYEKITQLWPEVASVSARTYLPLIELTIPALRHLRLDEFQQFSRALKWLIESDDQVSLPEFMLQKIIQRHLEPQFGQVRRAVVQYYTLRPLVPDCGVLLSALAQVGSNEDAEVERSFRKGAPYLRSQDGDIPLLPRDQCALEQIDTALNRLALAVPQIKKNLIEACVHVIGADGVIQENEAELLRAVADTLDCPIPPFLQVS